MDKIKIFLTKYGLYILVSGIVLLIIGTTWMNNLPSPYYLAPGEATTRYYVPVRIARVLKTIGIIGLLVGAFMTIRNFMAIKNSAAVDTDNITKAIADALIKNQNSAAQYPHQNVVMGAAVPPPLPPKTEVIEVKKIMTAGGTEFVYTDENNGQIVGINPILNHLIGKGYRIVNTIESNAGPDPVVQIIVEK